MAKYKIGQLSKTMGVSTHSIKHYEKFKLVYPCKDDATNYRYYDLSQYARIIDCKKFRNIGVPIKDISLLLNNSSNDDFNNILQHHISDLDSQIETLLHQKELAKTLYNRSKSCDKYLDEWFVDIMPSIYFLKQSNNKEIIEDNHSFIDDINLIDYVPIVEYILYINKESFTDNNIKYSWGLGFTEDNCYLINNNITKNTKFTRIESRKCFITYIKIQLPYISNGSLVNIINNILIKFSIKISSDILAFSIKKSNENGIIYEYLKICIPLN